MNHLIKWNGENKRMNQNPNTIVQLSYPLFHLFPINVLSHILGYRNIPSSIFGYLILKSRKQKIQKSIKSRIVQISKRQRLFLKALDWQSSEFSGSGFWIFSLYFFGLSNMQILISKKHQNKNKKRI